MGVQNLYIPGLENHPTDFKVVQFCFEKTGIDNLVNFYEDGRKPHEFFHGSEKIKKEILKRFMKYSRDNVTNIIAQSAGCNEAAIIMGEFGNRSSHNYGQISTATLMSPQFTTTPKDVMKEIETLSLEKYGELNIFKDETPPFVKFRLYRDYLKTRKLAFSSLDQTEIPFQLIYCDGDQFVYPEYLKILSKLMNVNLVKIGANSHNPFMNREGEKVAEKIKNFMNNNQRR